MSLQSYSVICTDMAVYGDDTVQRVLQGHVVGLHGYECRMRFDNIGVVESY